MEVWKLMCNNSMEVMAVKPQRGTVTTVQYSRGEQQERGPYSDMHNMLRIWLQLFNKLDAVV
jgi:hypothetical protein